MYLWWSQHSHLAAMWEAGVPLVGPSGQGFIIICTIRFIHLDLFVFVFFAFQQFSPVALKLLLFLYKGVIYHSILFEVIILIHQIKFN